MKMRKQKKYNILTANTNRLKQSALPSMRRLLNNELEMTAQVMKIIYKVMVLLDADIFDVYPRYYYRLCSSEFKQAADGPSAHQYCFNHCEE